MTELHGLLNQIKSQQKKQGERCEVDRHYEERFLAELKYNTA